MKLKGHRDLDIYYPGHWGSWDRRDPEDAGMDSRLLEEAAAFASDPEHETSRPVDLGPFLATVRSKNYHDDGEILGPTKPRGGMNGLILRHGYIVAEWGDTRRVDMTFSVTKSYLSTLAGLALERGLIRDVHDRLGDYVDDGGYDAPHNAKITWHHSLQQTSEWVGTLWGKHHFAGRDETKVREPEEPGTFFEYNDARVNRFALSLLHVWRRPLPQVLKELVMDPLDASPTWRWYGYRNSWVTIDGLRMQSVSGGGHWGGGMQISTRAHARFGLLFLRRGKWKGRQIVPESWIDVAMTPGDVNPSYGYMWWLDPNPRDPKEPATVYSARGAGGNRIWVDTEKDLVVVVRWLAADRFEGFLKRVTKAIKT